MGIPAASHFSFRSCLRIQRCPAALSNREASPCRRSEIRSTSMRTKSSGLSEIATGQPITEPPLGSRQKDSDFYNLCELSDRESSLVNACSVAVRETLAPEVKVFFFSNR